MELAAPLAAVEGEALDEVAADGDVQGEVGGVGVVRGRERGRGTYRDLRTHGRTDGQTDPLIEMRKRI